ncbi:MAG: hypothetical protein ABW215_10750, partial [Kibdelosporangium sp.]
MTLEAGPAAVVEMALAGRFAEVEELYSASLRALAPAGTLRKGWATAIADYGPVSAVGKPVIEAGSITVSVPVTCERGGFMVVMSFDDAGLMDGL